ncbi:MAG TPA: hypothetical protein VLS86_08965 [Acidimicrobiia bacterium]|nr:hypothetical protein [Acidimicrobiia bacterium]
MGKIIPVGPERTPLPPPPSRITRLQRRARHLVARRLRARPPRLGSGPVTHQEEALLSLMLWGRAIGWVCGALSLLILVIWGLERLLSS